jgi:NADPH:quinone reductase-like Zn-dependent oxidoreductase
MPLLGINPSDVKFVSGAMNPSLPRTPGRDFAGIVVSEGVLKNRRLGKAPQRIRSTNPVDVHNREGAQYAWSGLSAS